MAYVTGGLYQVFAPATTTPPYALMTHMSGTDTNSGNGARILSRLLFQVQIVGPVTMGATIRSAYARADALLQPSFRPLRNTDNTLACFREQTLSYGEIIGGTLWLHYGGTFRVEV